MGHRVRGRVPLPWTPPPCLMWWMGTRLETVARRTVKTTWKSKYGRKLFFIVSEKEKGRSGCSKGSNKQENATNSMWQHERCTSTEPRFVKTWCGDKTCGLENQRRRATKNVRHQRCTNFWLCRVARMLGETSYGKKSNGKLLKTLGWDARCARVWFLRVWLPKVYVGTAPCDHYKAKIRDKCLARQEKKFWDHNPESWFETDGQTLRWASTGQLPILFYNSPKPSATNLGIQLCSLSENTPLVAPPKKKMPAFDYLLFDSPPREQQANRHDYKATTQIQKVPIHRTVRSVTMPLIFQDIANEDTPWTSDEFEDYLVCLVDDVEPPILPRDWDAVINDEKWWNPSLGKRRWMDSYRGHRRTIKVDEAKALIDAFQEPITLDDGMVVYPRLLHKKRTNNGINIVEASVDDVIKNISMKRHGQKPVSTTLKEEREVPSSSTIQEHVKDRECEPLSLGSSQLVEQKHSQIHFGESVAAPPISFFSIENLIPKCVGIFRSNTRIKDHCKQNPQINKRSYQDDQEQKGSKKRRL